VTVTTVCNTARVLVVLAIAGLVMPDSAGAQARERRTLNPPSLPPTHGYSHIVIVPAGGRVVISGQVSVDSVGSVVGVGDFRAQCIQVFENLGRALRSVGADFEDLVRTDMYVTDLSQLDVLREIRARYLPAENPPASNLVRVLALYRPELMVEIAAEAVLSR
jgi:enamine deaminase RidA (YjgF/YER057c/UK114 family)